MELEYNRTAAGTNVEDYLKVPQLILAFALSAFVIKYTLFASARLPGNDFSIR